MVACIITIPGTSLLITITKQYQQTYNNGARFILGVLEWKVGFRCWKVGLGSRGMGTGLGNGDGASYHMGGTQYLLIGANAGEKTAASHNGAPGILKHN